jgi:hypothetical protein
MKGKAMQEIKVVITEEDRQRADKFEDGEFCIIATALHRMGHTGVHVTTLDARVDGKFYKFDEFAGCDFTSAILDDNPPRPFYGPDVVGKTLTLTEVE